MGIEPGAYISVLANNTLEHLEAWLAVPAYGRVLNTLNTRLAVPELAFMLDDCATETLIVDAANLDAGQHLRNVCPKLRQLAGN